MTNELEKQFFDTFGIEPKKEYYCPSCDTKLEEWKTEKGLYYMCGNCCECDYVLDSLDEEFEEILKNLSYRTEYPQITDSILLQLFDILRKYYNLDFWTIDDSFVMDVRDKSASYTNILYRTGGDLKHSILSSLQLIVNQKLNYNEKIKHQVRTLFEEG